MRFRILRLLLFCSAFVWGISIVGIFVPWATAMTFLEGFGAKPIAYDLMFDYWLRMASGAFFLVGILFLVAAIFPQRYANMIPLLGCLMVVEGLFLLAHGIRLKLPSLPFYADTSACLLTGIAIIYLRNTKPE